MALLKVIGGLYIATINLYKISSDRIEQLKDDLTENYNKKGTEEFKCRHEKMDTGKISNINYKMNLFYDGGDEGKSLPWNWMMNLFKNKNVSLTYTPKAVVLIETRRQLFAITFGHSYFKVDPYCDKEWAFDFARRLQYSDIRTLALTNPNSKKNKAINTYLNYEQMEWDSGEALTKLKAKIVLPTNFKLFNETLEIGNSIKLVIKEKTLRNIANIVHYINETIRTQKKRVEIPFFKLIKSKKEAQRLKENMLKDIKSNLTKIDFSEYQVHATKLIFNEIDEYELKYGNEKKNYQHIDRAIVLSFMKEFNIEEENLLDIKVSLFIDGNIKNTISIEKMIFYTNEKSNSVFSDGSWYIYNEYYLDYLQKSISEISVEYDTKFNYSKKEHNKFLEEEYNKVKSETKYKGLEKSEVLDKLKNIFYKENYYNIWLTRNFSEGFENYDRSLITKDQHKLEMMDLYRSGEMVAVKFGAASNKLAYAIDQSMEGIKHYHKNKFDFKELNIEKVCIWIILERKELNEINGQPDINELKLLIFKNKLDQWKKEVRLLGYRPIIRINYSKK